MADSAVKDWGGTLAADTAETQELLLRARQGDQQAITDLCSRHRARLQRAVELQLDHRLAARLDPADVVQETYLEAARRLPEFFARGELPFYLWLRWLAREQVLLHQRRHLGTEKRALGREERLPIDSSAQFVRGILGKGPTPSRAAAAAELAERLHQALGQLDESEREIILWRHFEQLTNGEVAELLGIAPAAASKRHLRAVARLRGLLLGLGLSGVD